MNSEIKTNVCGLPSNHSVRPMLIIRGLPTGQRPLQIVRGIPAGK